MQAITEIIKKKIGMHFHYVRVLTTSCRLSRALLLGVCVCFLICACNSQRTWTFNLLSPDGKFVATARAYDNPKGFGMDAPGSVIVEINWKHGTQKPILIFSEAVNQPDGVNVEMHWLTADHLEIAFDPRGQVDFVASLWNGVSITTRPRQLSNH